MASTLRIVCGSYERVLCGLDAMHDEKTGLWLVNPVFVYSPHSGCIKAAAIGGHILATGSTDEVIKLYNVHKRVEMGSLMQHNGSITDLAFYGTSHLLSASEDGNVCIWRSSDWECMKVLKGHKGPVHSISVHRSGKLALSCGKDRTLRMWDLVVGRSAFSQKLTSEPDLVQWSPTGDYYAVVLNNKVDIYAAKDASIFHSISTPKRITVLTFVTDALVLLGGEDNTIRGHDLTTKKEAFVVDHHTSRIRGLKVAQLAKTTVLVSVSSDGAVCLWDLTKLSSPSKAAAKTEPLTTYSTSIRLTCLTTTLVKQQL